jgi:glucose/arabinose dehydrogenase
MTPTLFTLLFLFTVGFAQNCPNPLANAAVPTGFCASVWASTLSTPRGLAVGPNGDILVVEGGAQRVTALWEEDGTTQRAVIATAAGINHGIVINSDYLYASSSSTLYRWRYTGNRSNLGTAQVVLNSIPTGGHATRTPVFDSQGFLYVSVGSGSNVDTDSRRARVLQFNITEVPQGGFTWSTGVLFSDGLRNEVGLEFDNTGRLWGVENGCDNLARPDLGGDIHNNNPAEEVNLLHQPGGFYGYPYCWSEYALAPEYAKGKGTQWAHPNFMDDGTHTDEWCQNTNNVIKPAYSMGAHQAPLDIKFYYGTSFPSQYQGGAFVTLHGSWNRSPPQGYRVLHLEFANGLPVSESVFLANNGAAQNWPNNVRPVAMAISKCNGEDCIFITSDASGQIIKMTYTPVKPDISNGINPIIN